MLHLKNYLPEIKGTTLASLRLAPCPLLPSFDSSPPYVDSSINIYSTANTHLSPDSTPHQQTLAFRYSDKFFARTPASIPTKPSQRDPGTLEFMSIENLKTFGESSPRTLHMNKSWGMKKYGHFSWVSNLVKCQLDFLVIHPQTRYCARYLRDPANIPGPTDPFAEADEDTGETKQSQNYIHIRIQREFISESRTPSWNPAAQPRFPAPPTR